MFRRLVFVLAVAVVALSSYRAVQAAASPAIASLDFDSNGKADLVVFRPSEGKFFVLQGSSFATAFSISSSSATAVTDTLLPAGDYTGDGATDSALYRPVTAGPSALAGTWTIQAGPTFTASTAIAWGSVGDQPLPGDWDGDGRLDVAVYRPGAGESRLYVLQGGTSFTTAFTIIWGTTGDIPCPGDYDGDGRLDFAVFRAAENRVFVLQGGNGFTSAFSFPFTGFGTQTFLPGDYDGDQRLDFASYNTTTLGPSYVVGTWTIAQNGTASTFSSQFSVSWGNLDDVPVPGDYDGDTRLDIAVWRQSENRFYVLQGGTGFTSAFSVAWGTAGDTPIGLRNPMNNTVF